MKIFRSLILVFVFMFCSVSFSADKTYLIKFKPGVSFAQAINQLEVSGLRLNEYIKDIDVYVARLQDNHLFQANQSLLSSSTLYIEKDAVLKAFLVSPLVPNDTLYADQKEMQRIKPEQAWDLSQGSKEVVVAVSDTGYTFDHVDLKTQIWTNPKPDPANGDYPNDIHGWDFVDNDNDPTDVTNPGHGTHVSGIIGAQGNNAAGIAGINFQTSIMPVRFLDKNGSGSTSNGVKTILYAANHGARLVNASWGGGDASQTLLDAIRYAYGKGTLVIAAAGNGDSSGNGVDIENQPTYPASFDDLGLIAVASSSADGTLSSFSNFGIFSVDLVAPGSNILSTLPGNKWGKLSGTSMATPHVTGVGALILSKAPGLSVIELRNAILNAIDVKSNYKSKISTQGDLNAYKALDQLRNGFQIWPSHLTLKKGSQYPLSAYQPSGAVSWSVSPTNLASVSADGVLSATAEGEVMVKAKDALGHLASDATVEIVSQSTPPPPPNGCRQSKDPGGALASLGFPLFMGFLFRRRKKAKCAHVSSPLEP